MYYLIDTNQTRIVIHVFLSLMLSFSFHKFRWIVSWLPVTYECVTHLCSSPGHISNKISRESKYGKYAIGSLKKRLYRWLRSVRS